MLNKIFCLHIIFASILSAQLLKPSDLSLKALSSSEILIKWRDNSDSETGYKIFRDGELIMITAANVNSFVDKNLLPNHRYRYTIKATDDAYISYYKGWKKRYLLKIDNSMSRITIGDKNNTTVSEAQGYGMLIEALLPKGVDIDDQKIFNSLWRFSRSHPSSICKNLMNWKFDPNDVKDDDSAFDGDADIAYALIKADEKWGSGGDVDYKQEATKILKSIWDCTIGRDSKLPLLGDWVEQDGQKYNQYSARTSDFILGHFRKFAQFSGDERWLDVVKASQKALQDVQDKHSGLIPDFIKKDNSGHYVAVEDGFLEENDGDYYYNACRVPWRLGVDVMASHDSVSKTILSKITEWIKQSSNDQAIGIKAGYRLNGDVIGEYDTKAFIAPFGVAAMALGDRSYAEKIREYIKGNYEGYYEDTIALLSLLAMDGIY